MYSVWKRQEIVHLLVGKSEDNIPFRRQGRMWIYNIKITSEKWGLDVIWVRIGLAWLRIGSGGGTL
jgi:hypothetical protein